ncbi:hypothetical protein QLQ12_35880 [Actinoplanes sp. NEAU-A12]|uniref:DUF5671 domain-containing protein n=1 Tax=Actinoplanes sandaracinus TaxID=3045177 RepID=A0ABT6WWB3_9ACTN|nr:hypothetical protein [Actinoplanes sandaracinus]MDI6103984.1 hypothetical protein [Actinoplanes sandaracinus]
MADRAGEPEPLSGRIAAWAGAIAPISLISAVLFYFGYVSSRAQYEYFGVDVDAIGLGTQDYIMRSPQPLLVPILTLTLLGAGGLLLHLTMYRRISAALRARRQRRIRLVLRAGTCAGTLVLVTAVLLLFAYGALRDWAPYGLVVPVLMIFGTGLIGYTWRLTDQLPPADPPSDERSSASRQTDGPERQPAEEPALRAAREQPAVDGPTTGSADRAPGLRRVARFLIAAVLVAAIFWATATIAQWSGSGLARDIAARPDHLPRVILDTKERLYLRNNIVEETRLPAAEDQEFRFRYRRLRLLVIGKDRMFLVPELWSASNTTLVVPIGDTVRVQFQFQNDPP